MAEESSKSPETYSVSVSAETSELKRQNAPAAERNTAPILSVLKSVLPGAGHALELASGTGQHAAAFAAAFPGLQWQPSDPSHLARESIAAWREHASLPNIASPIDLDVSGDGWERELEKPCDAILAINLIHIAPRSVTIGLMRGAGLLLDTGGLVFLYGPYRRHGEHTAPSNARFEEWLKAQSEEFAVPHMEEVEAEGAKNGLTLADVIDMPANNFSLVFRKS